VRYDLFVPVCAARHKAPFTNSMYLYIIYIFFSCMYILALRRCVSWIPSINMRISFLIRITQMHVTRNLKGNYILIIEKSQLNFQLSNWRTRKKIIANSNTINNSILLLTRSIKLTAELKKRCLCGKKN
jgi:hypothetical protein